MIENKEVIIEKQEIIKVKIKEIIHSILDNEELSRLNDKSLLHIILSESSQALEFVCAIEEEFDIEFEDDEVDLNFFSSFDRIISLVIEKI